MDGGARKEIFTRRVHAGHAIGASLPMACIVTIATTPRVLTGRAHLTVALADDCFRLSCEA